MDSNDLEFDTFAAIDIVKMEEEVKPEVDHAPADFRSRCNTWPRQQFQQELTPQQQLQQKALQPFFRQADFKDVGGTRVPDFGSNSGLNNLQSGSFLMANRHISTGSPWRTKVATQTGNNGGSPPSTATSGMAPGVGGILPLVSEEDFMDDLGSILSQGTTASNDFDLVSPSTSSMDIGSPSMVNDDVAGHFGSSSSSEMSPKQKTTTRRNPWGNMSYADLITQAIQSSPEQRLTLAQIYDWLVKNIPYFREKGDSVNSIGWKNSIRHNLSLHSRFVRVQNEGTGKSSWWTINPENGKQPNNQVAKHARRRAQTLESASLQSIRPGRRGRTGGGGPSISRRRDSSGSNARTTPVLGRRPSGNQLERASSHQSLVYPDSPILFRHQQSSPDYIHLNNLSMPGQNPSFAGPIHCRTLSNASSCAGGRLSPFRSRASSAYSLDGSQTATTSPSSAWNSQTPPPPTPLPHFNLTEQHLLHDASESREQERSQSESKDSLNLSPADLDAMRLLDFDSTQLLMALGENDFGDQSFKDQQLTTADSRSEQELQQQLIKSNSKVGHKIKILEPRETATNSDFPTSKFETQPRMWMNQTPSQSFSVYQQQTMDRNATSNTQDKNQFNLNENNYYSAMVDDLLKSAFPTNFDPSDLDLNMFLARGTSDLDSFNSLSAKPTAEMSQTQIKSELQAFDTMLMKQFDLCNMMSSKPNSTSPSQKYTNSQDLTMIDLATIKSEPLDTKENIDLNPFETMSSKSQSSEHNIANMISTKPNVATNERISSSVSTSASPNSYYSASSNVGGFYRLSNNSNSSSALTLETF